MLKINTQKKKRTNVQNQIHGEKVYPNVHQICLHSERLQVKNVQLQNNQITNNKLNSAYSVLSNYIRR